MSEYIDRKVVLNILSSKNAPWDGYQKVLELHAADVVSKAAYDQVAWERNLAEEQLKSIGKSFGEKMDDVQLVKHGKNIATEYDEVDQFVCSECGIELQGWVRIECDEDDGDKTYHEYRFNFCPNCGARNGW